MAFQLCSAQSGDHHDWPSSGEMEKLMKFGIGKNIRKIHGNIIFYMSNGHFRIIVTSKSKFAYMSSHKNV